jgi:hypothetical protein
MQMIKEASATGNGGQLARTVGAMLYGNLIMAGLGATA